MTNRLTVVLTTALLCLPMVLHAAEQGDQQAEPDTNMVINGGFETTVADKTATIEICHAKSPLRDKFTKNRKPTDLPRLGGWSFQDWTTTGPAELSLDDKTVARGKQSLKVVMPKEGTGITLKQYVNGAKPNTAYKLSFLVRRSDVDQKIGIRAYCYPDSKHRNITVRFFTEQRDNDFYEVTWLFPTYEKTDRILLLIGMKNASRKPSTVWIDQVRLEKANLED